MELHQMLVNLLLFDRNLKRIS